MHLSLSNLFNRTHQWNLMSSISINLPREVLPCFSNRSLSLRPSLSSGIPLRKLRICTRPIISEERTVPFAETNILSFSITSRKISFFMCLMSTVKRRKLNRGWVRTLLKTYILPGQDRILKQMSEMHSSWKFCLFVSNDGDDFLDFCCNLHFLQFR